jgi:hypothetical protein
MFKLQSKLFNVTLFGWILCTLLHSNFLEAQNNRQLPAISTDIHVSLTRQLPSGSSLLRENVLKFYRDANGNTRLEQGDQVMIINKSAREMYQLNLKDRIAKVRVLSPQARMPASNALNHLDKLSLPDSQSSVGEAPEHRRQVSDLGSKLMGTVQVHGTKIMDTTPAHSSIGNDSALVRTTESWRSDDLGVALVTKIDDPVSGKITKELQNLKVNAVLDPSMFQIPAGFQIQSVSSANRPK